MVSSRSSNQSIIPAFLRDIRVLQVIGQIVFVILVVTAMSLLISSIFQNLAAKNLAPTFTFLNNRSGFDISNAPTWYSSDSSYWTAFQVGMTNTLRVVSAGLVLATALGILVGILLLSSNWLIRTVARGYVELLRNTPLLVQLFVWYFIFMLTLLPQSGNPVTFPTEGVSQIPIRLLIYIIAFFVLRRWSNGQKSESPFRWGIMPGFYATVIAVEIGFWLGNTQEAWAAVYASGNVGNGGFLLYFAVSVLLIAGCWFFIPKAMRWTALGIAGGQLIGGLLFYFGIIPNAGLRQELYPLMYISNRGFVFPEIIATARFTEWITFVAIGLALAIMMWLHFGQITENTGKQIPRGLYAVLAVIGFTILGWLLTGTEPEAAVVPIDQNGTTVYMSPDDARSQGLFTEEDDRLYSTVPLLVVLPRQRVNKAGIVFNNFERGVEIQPEYMALLLGLVVYTSAFIAEIVRAGIQSVPRGQIEASRALGLTTSQTLRMIVLPQALRVIIPPLGNQYLNLSKNSSLAVAIAYADVVLVTQTIMNQSGQSVTGISMLMVFYLIISLTISVFTNWFNRRFKLVTR